MPRAAVESLVSDLVVLVQRSESPRFLSRRAARVLYQHICVCQAVRTAVMLYGRHLLQDVAQLVRVDRGDQLLLARQPRAHVYRH